MNRILVLMLSISTITLASDAGNAGTDIVQRTVNFVLFAGLVWYLVAEPAKAYFASRSEAIADDLKRVQNRLNESIALKKESHSMTKILFVDDEAAVLDDLEQLLSRIGSLSRPIPQSAIIYLCN